MNTLPPEVALVALLFIAVIVFYLLSKIISGGLKYDKPKTKHKPKPKKQQR